MKGPHMETQKGFTHYSYLGGPDGLREPTGLYDLAAACEETRRKLIHGLVRNGELLAVCPFGTEIKNMLQLRNALKWLRDNR